MPYDRVSVCVCTWILYTIWSTLFHLAWHYFNKMAISNKIFHVHLMEYVGNEFNGIWFCHSLSSYTLFMCIMYVQLIRSSLVSPFSCYWTHLIEREKEKRTKDRCGWASPKMRLYFILCNLISKMCIIKSTRF